MRSVVTVREQAQMTAPWRYVASTDHDLLTGYHDYLSRYRGGQHDPQTLADYIDAQRLDPFQQAELWDHADKPRAQHARKARRRLNHLGR